MTCRPNIPVSDPQYSAVFIFIFSFCLSVVAVNVVVVSKDPCCLMLCKLTQTISSCVPVCTYSRATFLLEMLGLDNTSEDTWITSRSK